MIDDGPRSSVAFGLLGTGLLTMLEYIDRMDELKPGSKYRDLGMVMALFLKMSIEPAEIPMEDEDLYWRPHLMAYAKKAGIDLGEQGIDGLDREDQPMKRFKDVEPMESNSTNDRWDWTTKYQAFERRGGNSYNILKFSRQKRRHYNVFNKDPLQQFSVKDLREGNILVA